MSVAILGHFKALWPLQFFRFIHFVFTTSSIVSVMCYVCIEIKQFMSWNGKQLYFCSTPEFFFKTNSFMCFTLLGIELCWFENKFEWINKNGLSNHESIGQSMNWILVKWNKFVFQVRYKTIAVINYYILWIVVLIDISTIWNISNIQNVNCENNMQKLSSSAEMWVITNS